MVVEVEPDRYPADLSGRWVSRSFEDPFEIATARLGSTERVRLAGEMSVLGIAEERIVTMRWAAASWVITISSVDSGNHIAGPFEVDARYQIDELAGTSFVVAMKHLSTDDVPGLSLISLSDGTVVDLVPAMSQEPSGTMYREAAVSADGNLVATAICASGIDFTGECRETQVFDLTSRKATSSPEVDGGKVVAVVDGRLLLYWQTRAQLRNMAGEVIWTTKAFPDGYFLWSLQPIDARTIAAVLYSYASGGSSRVLVIDAATGRARTVYERAGAMALRVDASLSTPSRIAMELGDERGACDEDNNGFCDQGTAAVVDRAALDVETGTVTRHAIHLTITP